MTSKHRVGAIAAAVLVSASFSMAVYGQSPPTTGTPSAPPGGTSPGTGTTRTTPSTPTTTNPNTTPGAVNVPQPIFVSGHVMMEDGTAPTSPITIETVCNGSPHAEGYTDSKGFFAVELGARNGVIQDASEYSSQNGLGIPRTGGSNAMPGTFANTQAPERRYMGCDLRAKLDGYRSQLVPLAGRRSMDAPDIGIILLHRIGPAEEGNIISAVSLAAPKDAKKAYEKGQDALKKKKFEDAQLSFEKAVEAYPKYAAAWYELGMLQAGAGKMDMARKYFDKASECDPKFIQPYLQRSILDLQDSNWQSLADVTDKALKLDPFSYPQAFYFNAVANYNLHNMAAAEKSALAAERLDTRHTIPKVSHLLGLILALKKDYEGAALRLNDYLKYAPDAPDAAKVRSQLAEVEKVTAASAARQQ